MRHKNKKTLDVKENTIWDKICRFRPPLILTYIGVTIFSTLSLVAISTQWGEIVPTPILYIIYVLAAIFLFTAIWTFFLLVKSKLPFHIASSIAHQYMIISKLLDDDAFRIVSLGYGSLVFNSLLAISKIVAAWWFSSKWLMVLAVYYLVLCMTKFLILRNSRSDIFQSQKQAQRIMEWKSYRLCGCLLIILSFALQGVAIMIIKEGNCFRYHGYLIFVVALYDFYCLITSIIYLVKNRKYHSSTIIAIKYISFATSIVSMLSLQTAMFASFGEEMTQENQKIMNILTSTAICGILVVLGVVMIIKSNKMLKH